MSRDVTRRLERLEDKAREEAASEIRRVWFSFTDEEIALLLAPYWPVKELPDEATRFTAEPTPKEREAEERARALMPEDLIARAISYREEMDEEEVGRRLGKLVEPVLSERGAGIRRCVRAEEANRGEGVS